MPDQITADCPTCSSPIALPAYPAAPAIALRTCRRCGARWLAAVRPLRVALGEFHFVSFHELPIEATGEEAQKEAKPRKAR
jgi:hypothetical protein